MSKMTVDRGAIIVIFVYGIGGMQNYEIVLKQDNANKKQT